MNGVKAGIDVFKVVQAARQAGAAVLEIYHSDFTVKHKDDQSPLTLADTRAHKIISDGLSGLYPDIPLLSEEGQNIPYEERRQWEFFWLVDPLDGTKEFIKRNGEFTVNIALIHKDAPVMGIVYAPAKGALYFASEGEGAYRVDNADETDDCKNLDELLTKASRLPLDTPKEHFTVAGSRSHMSKETEEYIEGLKRAHGQIEMIPAGSSLKFCLVAEGRADVYPRFAPTMEWDTAAGHVIAKEAGASVTQAGGGAAIRYNKEDLLNPWFVGNP